MGRIEPKKLQSANMDMGRRLIYETYSTHTFTDRIFNEAKGKKYNKVTKLQTQNNETNYISFVLYLLTCLFTIRINIVYILNISIVYSTYKHCLHTKYQYCLQYIKTLFT